jgi:actin-related protein
MVDRTRKKKVGGDSNIFAKYEPEEIQKRLNNYLAATYALKQATAELIQSVKLKNDTTNRNSTYFIEKQNSENFKKATQKFSELVSVLNTNIR